MKSKSETQSLYSETQQAYHVEKLAPAVLVTGGCNNLLRVGLKQSEPMFERDNYYRSIEPP